MTSRSALLSLPTFLLALSLVEGCPAEAPVPDAGDPVVQVPLDGGGGDNDDDAGPRDAGLEDVPPEDPSDLAEELCLAYRRGEQNASLALAQALSLSGSRCSNEDPLLDVTTHPELLVLPPGACTRADELRRMLEEAFAGGRVSIDVAAFRACIERGRALRAEADTVGEAALREAGIAALVEDEHCAAAITPLVGEGGACVQAWDCIAPLRCEADPVDGNALRCLPPAAEGERCVTTPPDGQQSARTCAAGTVCVLDICTRRVDANAPCEPDGVPCAEGFVCGTAGVCAPPSAEGGPCASDDQCAGELLCSIDGTCAPPVLPLADGEACGEGLPPCAGPCSVCRPDDQGALRCQDRGGENAPCDALDHCRAGFTCAAGADGGPSTCAPYGAAGEPCDGAIPCAEGLVCAPPPAVADAGVTGPVCQPLPGIGEACDAFPCGEGTCIGGVCVAGVVGEPCLGDETCEDDLICVEGACLLPPRVGAPCAADGRCTEAAWCDGERCRPFPAPGEACAPGNRCEDGAFCNAGSCEALRIPGAACANDEMCASGLCLETGTCATRGASCYSTQETFAQLLGLSLLVPLALRLRRRRR